jgi:hypothetical protein
MTVNPPSVPSAARLGASQSPLVLARLAAVAGFSTLVSGSFAGYVAGALVVPGDPAATAGNVVASESLWRLGMAGGLVMMIAFLFYGVLLHQLLAPVNRRRALIMLALVVASVPIYMLNEVNQFAVLRLASDGLREQVAFYLDLHRFGNLVASIFFGLWLFPLGLLVYRSGFLPRFLGILLVLGSPGYVVLFAQGFLVPGGERTLWSSPLLMVTHLAELALLLWLSIKGVHVGRWELSRRAE